MAKRKRGKKAATVAASGGPVDGVLAKGLAHGTRAEILAFLAEHEIASPVEMDKAGLARNGAGDPKRKKLAHISYHVRVLEKLGLVKFAYSRPVRGATEHFYIPNARMLLTIEDWSGLPESAKNDVSIAALEETFALARKALSAHTFDTFDERAVINLTLRLTDGKFRLLAEELTEFALKRCEQLQAESIGEVDGDLARLKYFSTSMLAYESPPPKRPEP
jgi:DNA-binding transcriptional ArsR family regulator